MSASTLPARGRLRVGLVVLLVLAAFFAALPWLGCVGSHPLGIFAGIVNDGFLMFRLCTWSLHSVGQTGIPGFTGPYYGSLVFGIVFIVAALFAAFTKRPL